LRLARVECAIFLGALLDGYVFDSMALSAVLRRLSTGSIDRYSFDSEVEVVQRFCFLILALVDAGAAERGALAVFHALCPMDDGSRLRSGLAVWCWEMPGLDAAGRARNA
jgi:hypothetical protein